MSQSPTPTHQLSAVRVSDREGEEVVGALRKHAGDGRLDVNELDERLDAVYAARTRSDLEPLTADLPPIVPPSPARSPKHRDLGGHVLAFVAVNVLLIIIWAATGAGYFWPIWPLLGWGFGLFSRTSGVFFGRSLGPCSHRARRPLHVAR